MIRGRTNTGFEFEIEDDALDNYELLEVITSVDKGDLSAVPKMVDMLLGPRQKEKLKEHVRSAEGRVSATAMMDEVTSILSAKNELKN